MVGAKSPEQNSSNPQALHSLILLNSPECWGSFFYLLKLKTIFPPTSFLAGYGVFRYSKQIRKGIIRKQPSVLRCFRQFLIGGEHRFLLGGDCFQQGNQSIPSLLSYCSYGCCLDAGDASPLAYWNHRSCWFGEVSAPCFQNFLSYQFQRNQFFGSVPFDWEIIKSYS